MFKSATTSPSSLASSGVSGDGPPQAATAARSAGAAALRPGLVSRTKVGHGAQAFRKRPSPCVEAGNTTSGPVSGRSRAHVSNPIELQQGDPAAYGVVLQ